jgi:hypothetical protein
MGSDSRKVRAAYVEDCDEDDQAVRGTRHSAKIKSDRHKGERKIIFLADQSFDEISKCLLPVRSTGSEKSSSSSPRSKRVEVVKEQSYSTERGSRRNSMSGTSSHSPRKSSSRPPLSRNNATAPPKLDIPQRDSRPDPSYYGVSPNVIYTPNTSVRASRPASYYAGMPAPYSTAPMNVSRPPMARSAFYVSPTSATVPTSYPSTSSYGSYMPYAAPQPDYFTAAPPPGHLAERFNRLDPLARSQSTTGVKQSDAYLGQAATDLLGRNIIRRLSKEAEDAQMMPPPALRRSSRDIPVTYSNGYDGGSYYEPRSGRGEYQDSYATLRPLRRHSVSRGSVTDQGSYRVEPAGSRRSSYYDDRSPQTSNYEDQLRAANGYQNEVNGGPTVPLTAETLRKQQRATGSSRSTRSSGSRDESDFKRSATTRTTTSRVVDDGDDFTIRFKGGATVNIGGAEIKCEDGAEVNIVRSKSTRNGSEASRSDYGVGQIEERRSREKRPSIHSRSTSKSGFSNPISYRGPRPRDGFF